MRVARSGLIAILILAGAAPLHARTQTDGDLPPPAARRIDFDRDVRPILESRCLSCHGPDKRKGGLRLDSRELALAGGDTGPAFEPLKSDQSLLIEKVAAPDESSVMPPSGDRLTTDQIGILRAWIDQGAQWDAGPLASQARAAEPPRHWAFLAPSRPVPPIVKQSSWPRNPIDAFVLARLEQEGLSPSPEANPSTLIRRLYLDLIGLPPTPEEVLAFVEDHSPHAYTRLVDRLLSSPAYGERWARRWLDLARYADTNGYEKDRERSIWPYRDWVIHALNEDKPFDTFTIEQIAGDLLPNPSTNQRIATGFHRNTMINEEGGIDVEEFRFASLVDRVATTGTVWLGLTIGCAQCHTHKYDPITQREYYQLMAFLNNADEPDLIVPDPLIEARRAEISSQIAALRQALPQRFLASIQPADQHTPDRDPRKLLEARQTLWEASIRPVRWIKANPIRVESRKNATMEVLPDLSVLVGGDNPNNDVYTIAFDVPAGGAAAIRIEALPHESLPDGGPGRAPLFSVGDFLLTEVELVELIPGSQPRPIGLHNATESYSAKDRPASLAIDGISDTGWQIAGGTGQPQAAVFQFQRPIPSGRLLLTLHQEYIHQMTLGRFRISTTSDPAAQVVASGLPAEIEDALLTPASQRSELEAKLVCEHFLSVAPELEDARNEIAALQASMPRLATTMVMQERKPEHSRTTRIHQRGEFLRPGEPVEPGTPAILHPLPQGNSHNRLALAQWLVADDNPLVARVTVNRAWQAFFGRGIVPTLDDFGTRGDPPSHPDLLDWLAVEFRESGWSMKSLHRLIVTSATYRQSSQVTHKALARDPKNILLGRAPRFRVEAETIRDLALSAAGLLHPRLGGPSVFPPQPESVTGIAYGQVTWPTSHGPDRFRRGLYTYIKRTAPYASFSTFDMPTSETSCARRERTDTPLQALTLLNDSVFVEASQALASRLLAEFPSASPASRADRLFRLCLSRPPTPDELSLLISFYQRQLMRFESEQLNAAAVAGVDHPEQAAWTTLARALLNLDEMITRD